MGTNTAPLQSRFTFLQSAELYRKGVRKTVVKPKRVWGRGGRGDRLCAISESRMEWGSHMKRKRLFRHLRRKWTFRGVEVRRRTVWSEEKKRKIVIRISEGLPNYTRHAIVFADLLTEDEEHRNLGGHPTIEWKVRSSLQWQTRLNFKTDWWRMDEKKKIKEAVSTSIQLKYVTQLESLKTNSVSQMFLRTHSSYIKLWRANLIEFEIEICPNWFFFNNTD